MGTSKLFGPSMGIRALVAAAILVGCDSGSDAPVVRDTGKTSPTAAVPQNPEPAAGSQRAVISERLPYGEIGDELVYGFFTAPSDMVEPLPAVLIIHESWGLNDSVRDAAEKLAAEGYIVFAVDLFAGNTATSPAAARELVAAVVENRAAAESNIREAYEFVREAAGAPRVGVLGWGFGAGWALDTAAEFGDRLDAVVIYYGEVSGDEDKLRPITAPLLAHFGGNDKLISQESVTEFDEALQRLRKNHTIENYPRMGNAFASAASKYYSPKIAEKAWHTTLEFLDLHLSIDTADSADESS